MFILKVMFGCMLSYLIGSIPTAYIFGRVIKGIDIRKYGSGNIGTTNAIRVLGKGPGLSVFAIDIAKGVLATVGVARFLGIMPIGILVLFGIIAVCGHNWTIFLEFKGGKGVATSLGVLIGLAIAVPSLVLVMVLTLVLWAAVFLATGYVSLASISASVFLPVSLVIWGSQLPLVFLGMILCAFVVLRHRPNIKRLLSKTEPRVKTPFRKESPR